MTNRQIRRELKKLKLIRIGIKNINKTLLLIGDSMTELNFEDGGEKETLKISIKSEIESQKNIRKNLGNFKNLTYIEPTHHENSKDELEKLEE